MTFGKSTAVAFAMIGLSSIALLGACGGKTSTAAPVALADVPSAYAHAICDNIKGCCAQTNFTYDGAKCVDAVTAELKAILPTSSPSYDANAAGECIAFYQRAAASCGSVNDDDVQKACNGIYSGTKKIGDVCKENDNDCAASSEGQVECKFTGSNVNQCVLIRTAQAGDACGLSADGTLPTTLGDCTSASSPLYCSDASKTCQPRLGIGSACRGGQSCITGAGCVNGTCAAAPTAGQPCDDSFNCADGFYCDVNKRACATKKKPGDACNFAERNSCSGGTCSSGTCTAGDLTNQNVCAGNGALSSSSGSGG